ncbi:MAG: ComEA family DNA-binding protein [Chloroflexi bacterium]|nr:ComEA family DNA-binding protein [Chloroflexota bacterium]
MATSGTKRLIAIGMSGAVALSLLCVAAWMIFNGGTDVDEPDGIQIIVPEASAEADTTGSPKANTSAPAPSPAAPPEQITVYVTGEVIRPGVYTVDQGERLDAVLRLAGGPTEDADLNRINLAAYASDATHYDIPGAGEPAAPTGSSVDASAPKAPESAPSEACPVPVNINTANAQCLETLPGIGGVRADSIVTHREQEGPFASPEAITDVPGIGEGIFRGIAEMITVAPR